MIEGRVVDLRGEGVPAAKVTVTSPDETEVLARGVADGEGFFRIPRVAAADWHRVFADSEGHCRGASFVSAEYTSARIQVHDSVTVRGRLIDRAGEPVAGAIVRSTPAMRSLPGVRVDATTTADGRFEPSGVPLGQVQFAAVVPGEGLAVQTRSAGASGEVTLQPADEPTTMLCVVVTGVPAANIGALSRTRIVPYGLHRLQRLPPVWERPTFGPDGVCELGPVPRGWECLVVPGAQGFTFEPRERRAKISAVPLVMQFVARPCGSPDLKCAARLVDPDGRPLVGVSLVMRAANGSDRAEATTDADGRVVFDSPHGVGTEVIVYSTDDRWVLDQRKDEKTPGGTDRRMLPGHVWVVDPGQELDLRAVAASSVTGRLSSPVGRPAAYVPVRLEQSQPGRRPVWMAFAHATTDREGRYRFRGLHHLGDPVRVQVESADGSLTSELIALDVPGTAVALPDVRLAPPATIEGTVVDAQQRPVPGVRVWLDCEPERNQRGSTLEEVVTDRLGRYRFVGVAPGGTRLQLVIDDEHPENVVEPFEVEPGQPYVHDLQLPAK